MFVRYAVSAAVLVASIGLTAWVSPAQAETRGSGALEARSAVASPDLGIAVRRASRTKSTVRLIVDARSRAELSALGVDIEDRIGSLPQFRAAATPDALSRVIRAGLAHAVSVDTWVTKPKPIEPAATASPSSAFTDAAGIVGAASLRQSGITGAGTAVAVIDDGIDASHPYFKRGDGTAIVAQGCFVTYMEQYPPLLPCAGNQSVVIGPDAANVGSDSQFTHGTHVAGIVAGNPTGVPAAQGTWGIAPGTNLVIGRVFGSFGAFSSDIIAGLDWVASVARQHNVVAVNLSLGAFFGSRINCTTIADAEYGAVVRRLNSAGVAVVAATGNAGSSMDEGMPACATGVVSVGATEADNSIAVYSNIAPATDLVAPGSMIWSSTSGGNFAAFSGTSMSTPVVSGSYALAHQSRAGLGNESWLSLFKSTALKVNDLVVKDLPLLQIDTAARMGAGIEVPGRPTSITVKETGLTSVSVSWSAPDSGPVPDDYVVTVGTKTMVTASRSVTMDKVYDVPAAVTVVGRVGGVPGVVGQGATAFPIDASLGSVITGSMTGMTNPTWSYCQPKAPGITLTYQGPQTGQLRTLRVTNGSAVQVVEEAALSGSQNLDRAITITQRQLWTDPATVVQVVGRGGALGPRWSLGSLVANAEKYAPPPPAPTQVRAASRKRALAVTWKANGAVAWAVYLNDRSVMTVTTPRAQISAPPGQHTVGVCALGDSGSQARGSVMVTARGQALK